MVAVSGSVADKECAEYTAPESRPNKPLTETGPLVVWVMATIPSMMGRDDRLLGVLVGPFESALAARTWIRTDPQLPGHSLHALVVPLQKTRLNRMSPSEPERGS